MNTNYENFEIFRQHWVDKAFRRELINEIDNNRILEIVEELIPHLSVFINHLTKKYK